MTFLDTNILVYSVDKKNPSKQICARGIVVDAIKGGNYMISAQVLNEFSNVALLKLQMTVAEVRKFVSMFKLMNVVSLDFEWTERALDIKKTGWLIDGPNIPGRPFWVMRHRTPLLT